MRLCNLIIYEEEGLDDAIREASMSEPSEYFINKLKLLAVEGRVHRFTGLANFNKKFCNINAVLVTLYSMDRLKSVKEIICNNPQALEHLKRAKEYLKTNSILRHDSSFGPEIAEKFEEAVRLSGVLAQFNKIRYPLYAQSNPDKELGPGFCAALIENLYGNKDALFVNLNCTTVEIFFARYKEQLIMHKSGRNNILDTYFSTEDIDKISAKYVVVSLDSYPDGEDAVLEIRGKLKELRIHSFIIGDNFFNHEVYRHFMAGFIDGRDIVYVDDFYKFRFSRFQFPNVFQEMLMRASTLIYKVESIAFIK